MYPVGAPQPIAEVSLGAGPPEPTNAAYAMAKLATAGMAVIATCNLHVRGQGREARRDFPDVQVVHLDDSG